MRVNRRKEVGNLSFELVDDQGEINALVAGFLRYLSARGCSPNTLSAYAHDLLHFLPISRLARPDHRCIRSC